MYLNVVCGGTALQAGRSWGQSPMGSLEFFLDLILPVALWPGVNSTSDRNEYQECLTGGKGSWCIGLTTLPLQVPTVQKFWDPRSLGALRAFLWASFTFFFHVFKTSYYWLPSLVHCSGKWLPLLKPLTLLIHRKSSSVLPKWFG